MLFGPESDGGLPPGTTDGHTGHLPAAYALPALGARMQGHLSACGRRTAGARGRDEDVVRVPAPHHTLSNAPAQAPVLLQDTRKPKVAGPRRGQEMVATPRPNRSSSSGFHTPGLHGHPGAVSPER